MFSVVGAESSFFRNDSVCANALHKNTPRANDVFELIAYKNKIILIYLQKEIVYTSIKEKFGNLTSDAFELFYFKKKLAQF